MRYKQFSQSINESKASGWLQKNILPVIFFSSVELSVGANQPHLKCLKCSVRLNINNTVDLAVIQRGHRNKAVPTQTLGGPFPHRPAVKTVVSQQAYHTHRWRRRKMCWKMCIQLTERFVFFSCGAFNKCSGMRSSLVSAGVG